MNELSIYHIHNIPEDDRPRERLLKHGADAISTAELIAIILGSGMKGMPVLQLAQQVIARFGSLEKLAEATIQEICEIKGMGQAKAIQLLAAINLGMRASRTTAILKEKILNPRQAYLLIKDKIKNEKKEHIVVVLLDAKGCVIHTQTVAIGTLTKSLVHPREIFNPAIRHNAASIILAHNHPSGDPTPSLEDLETTEQLIAAGQLIGIAINDHLIIGDNTYISIRQQGAVQFG